MFARGLPPETVVVIVILIIAAAVLIGAAFKNTPREKRIDQETERFAKK